MNINMKREDTKLTVSLGGRLDTLTSPDLENKLEPALEGVTELVIDLAALEYVSSAGLRVLLGAAQVMEDQGEMSVINANSDVMDIFNVTGFDEILNIV